MTASADGSGIGSRRGETRQRQRQGTQQSYGPREFSHFDAPLAEGNRDPYCRRCFDRGSPYICSDAEQYSSRSDPLLHDVETWPCADPTRRLTSRLPTFTCQSCADSHVAHVGSPQQQRVVQKIAVAIRAFCALCPGSTPGSSSGEAIDLGPSFAAGGIFAVMRRRVGWAW